MKVTAGQVLTAEGVDALSGLITLCERGAFGEVLPRRTLEHLGALLAADVVEISGLNPAVQVAYLCGADNGDCHRAISPAADTAAEQRFWRHYWFHEAHGVAGMRHRLSLDLEGCAGGSVRLTFWRAGAPAFDECSRVLLRLLKPHLERACGG